MAESTRHAVKVFAALIVLALASRWAPVLCSLLTIVVIVQYGGYAWRVIAKLPPKEATELLALLAVALGIGFLAKFGVGPLILTGLILLIYLPLRRRMPDTPKRNQIHADDEAQSDGA